MKHSAVWGTVILVACGSSFFACSNEGGGADGEDGDGADLGVSLDGQGGAGSGFSLEPGPITQAELDRLRSSACAGWSFEPELQPSVLQMIIDVSGSMDRSAPNSDLSKWVITRDALRDAVDGLPGTMSVGAVYYPNMDTDQNGTADSPGPAQPVSECVNLNSILEVDALGPTDSAHRDAFDSSLDAARPAGGTPTHDAYNVALDELAASDAAGQRFALLITDGQPTFYEDCRGSGYVNDPVDEGPIIDAIAAARQDGVRTFVIGSPGSQENASGDDTDDARPWLSRAAIEGGTATDGCSESGPDYCHFDMSEETDFGMALRRALAQIVGQISSCQIAVPEPPDGQSIDPEAVNVILTPFDESPEVVGRTEADTCEDGWSYTEAESEISLCENTCLRLRENSRSGIELLFGCSSATVVR